MFLAQASERSLHQLLSWLWQSCIWGIFKEVLHISFDWRMIHSLFFKEAIWSSIWSQRMFLIGSVINFNLFDKMLTFCLVYPVCCVGICHFQSISHPIYIALNFYVHAMILRHCKLCLQEIYSQKPVQVCRQAFIQAIWEMLCRIGLTKR